MSTGTPGSQGTGEARPEAHAEPVDAHLPRVVQPVASVLALASIPLVGGTLGGLGLLALTWGDPEEAFGAWLAYGVLVGPPLTLLLAWAGARVERLVLGVSPAPWRWLPMGLGVAIVTHWTPLVPWAPILVLASILEPHDSDEHLAGAFLALSALVAAAIGGAVAVGGSRLLAARTWPQAREPRTEPKVPSTLLVGATYLLATALPALLALAWATDEGTLIPLYGWGLVGLLAAGGMAWWARRWLSAAVSVVPALGPGSDAQPVEVSGTVFAAHWMVPYLIALTPALERYEDERAVVLAAAVVAATAGTAIWGVARARRVAARRAASTVVVDVA